MKILEEGNEGKLSKIHGGGPCEEYPQEPGDGHPGQYSLPQGQRQASEVADSGIAVTMQFM